MYRYNEEVISEVTEAERVVGLAPTQGERFGYALCNGTVGVYDGTRRQWRVKAGGAPHVQPPSPVPERHLVSTLEPIE